MPFSLRCFGFGCCSEHAFISIISTLVGESTFETKKSGKYSELATDFLLYLVFSFWYTLTNEPKRFKQICKGISVSVDVLIGSLKKKRTKWINKYVNTDGDGVNFGQKRKWRLEIPTWNWEREKILTQIFRYTYKVSYKQNNYSK